MQRVWLFKLLAVIATLLSLVLGTASAQAQAGTVGQMLTPCFVRAAPGMSAPRLIRTPEKFDCTTRQTAFGRGDFWAISQPLDRDSSDRRLGVRTLSTWQQRLTLYAFYADGKMATIATDAHAATRNLQLGAIINRYIPRRNAPVTRLIWHIEGSENLRGILIAPTLATAGQSALSNIIIAAVYAAFAGLCMALLLYNIGLARALRQGYLPFYCIMLVALLLYAFSSSGALAWALPDIANTARLRINYLTLAMIGVAAIAFLGHFFEEGVMTPWLWRLSHTAAAAIALPAIAVGLFAPWGLAVLDRAYSLGFVVLIGSIVPILYSAWVRKSPYLWLFITAWSVPISMTIARTAYSFNLLSYSFWLDHSTVVSMAVEAVLSSAAIAYRILLLSRERDEAREQEVAARLLADTDPLTGLLNRRAFLAQAIGRTGDQSLLVIDIDNFKRVNDTIGHDGGDEVLRVVARILRTATPGSTLVARIGGEEFAIVAAADRAADPEAILAALRAARMPFDLTVTASIGVCKGPLAREADWKTMYCRADRALFDAKAAGRDRVRAAQPPRYQVPVAA